MAGCSSYFVLQKHLIIIWLFLDLFWMLIWRDIWLHRSWLCQNTDVLIMVSMFMVSGDEPFAAKFTKKLSICNHMWFYDGSNIHLFIFYMFEADTVLRRLHGCVWLKGCNQCRRSIWAMFQWLWFGEFHFTTKIHQPRWTTSKQAHPILGYFRCLGFLCVKWIHDMWNFHGNSKFGLWFWTPIGSSRAAKPKAKKVPLELRGTPTIGCLWLFPRRFMPRKDGIYLQVTLNILEHSGFGAIAIEILGNSIILIMSLDQRWLVISC